MQHFPIFVALQGRRVVLSGGGGAAVAKLRLLLKTEARLTVFAADADTVIEGWAREGRLTLVPRAAQAGDAICAVLAYAANEDAKEDARFAALARAEGAMVNIVDNLQDSQFITPAIVDRDPVTVAIGTEGAAPVLARKIKADLEERLPTGLGVLARIGKSFRKAADALPMGRKRRDFWSDYYFAEGPRALAEAGEAGIGQSLENLLSRHLRAEDEPGHVAFVGAGPGDPELLTLKARRELDRADVVIHDRLVPDAILELVRREAEIISVGKEGFGPSTPQQTINELLVEHAGAGAKVVRLKSGDATVFGRLDEEIEALDAEGLDWSVVPGITAASAAVAKAGQSFTRRGRNSDVRFLTGHDVKGFAEHDWQTLARPGSVAAIYMAKRGARFLQGRLMMHGASAETAVTIVENASRPNERIIGCCLGSLSTDIEAAQLNGPAILLLGLAPRAAAATLSEFPRKDIAL